MSSDVKFKTFTVQQLKSWLTERDVTFPSSTQTKAFYLQLAHKERRRMLSPPRASPSSSSSAAATASQSKSTKRKRSSAKSKRKAQQQQQQQQDMDASESEPEEEEEDEKEPVHKKVKRLGLLSAQQYRAALAKQQRQQREQQQQQQKQANKKKKKQSKKQQEQQQDNDDANAAAEPSRKRARDNKNNTGSTTKRRKNTPAAAASSSSSNRRRSAGGSEYIYGADFSSGGSAQSSAEKQPRKLSSSSSSSSFSKPTTNTRRVSDSYVPDIPLPSSSFQQQQQQQQQQASVHKKRLFSTPLSIASFASPPINNVLSEEEDSDATHTPFRQTPFSISQSGRKRDIPKRTVQASPVKFPPSSSNFISPALLGLPTQPVASSSSVSSGANKNISTNNSGSSNKSKNNASSSSSSSSSSSQEGRSNGSMREALWWFFSAVLVLFGMISYLYQLELHHVPYCSSSSSSSTEGGLVDELECIACPEHAHCDQFIIECQENYQLQWDQSCQLSPAYYIRCDYLVNHALKYVRKLTVASVCDSTGSTSLLSVKALKQYLMESKIDTPEFVEQEFDGHILPHLVSEIGLYVDDNDQVGDSYATPATHDNADLLIVFAHNRVCALQFAWEKYYHVFVPAVCLLTILCSGIYVRKQRKWKQKMISAVETEILDLLDFGVKPRAVYQLKDEFWHLHRSDDVWNAVCERMERNPLVANRMEKIDFVQRKVWVYHGK